MLLGAHLEPEHLMMGTIVIVFVLDKVLGMLKSRGIDLQKMSREIEDLHEWHDIKDPEGMRLWYFPRRSLEAAIEKLAENIEKEAILLDRIDRRLERVENKVSPH